jgi:drug/metabolite transporter (DMT)-like permease
LGEVWSRTDGRVHSEVVNGAEIVLVLVTAVVLGSWVLYVTRLRGRRSVRTGLIVLTLLLLDGWLWDVAFQQHFGPQHWLIGPLAILNAVAALGVVTGGTGYRMRGGPDDRIAMSDPTYGRASAGFDEHRY